MLFGLWYISVI